MSSRPIRAGAGLVIALALTALAWPAAAESGPTDRDAPALAATEPPARTAGSVLADVSDRIVADFEAARHAHHLEAVAAWQAAEAVNAWKAAEAVNAWKAGEAAAEAERVAREAEQARIAEEARQAQAAAAPSGSLEAIIHRHFGAAAPAAIRIAQCESSMNPNARSATNDHGLFQINAVHRGQFEAVTGAAWSSVYDPELNTIYARHLYAQQGWSPWVCSRK